MKTLLKGGRVVSGAGVRPADVLLEGERIAAVGAEMTAPGAEAVDCTGKLLFPGFIDAHTHFDLEVCGTITADDFRTGSRAALAGGTTTVVDFAAPDKGESLHSGLRRWREKAEGHCACDYGFHMTIDDWNEEISREIGEMMDQGISSFKMYMTYPAMMLPEGDMYRALLRLKEAGGIAGVHCENDGVIRALTEEARAAGRLSPASHPRTRPAPPEVRQEVAEALFKEEAPPWQPPHVPSFAVHVCGTIGLSVVFFVLIPVCIYTASYFPYAAARGNGAGFWGMAGQSASWLWDTLPTHLERLPAQVEQLARTMAEEGKTPGVLDRIDSFFRVIPGGSANPVDIMLKNQHFMLTYHQGVHTPHPYESYWYQWIFDGRPILYFRDLDVPGMKSLFASFNNPLVSWAGLAAFFGVAVQTVRRRCGRGLFILIAILSQFVPWLPIGRILFAYHYFPTVLFLCFAIAYLMDGMMARRREGCRLAVYGFTGCAVGLYAVFYPELIGLYMPTWYAQYFLRWLPSWPL